MKYPASEHYGHLDSSEPISHTHNPPLWAHEVELEYTISVVE